VILALGVSTSQVEAGAVDRTCMQVAVAEGLLRIAPVHPRTCPPDDLAVTGGPKPFVLDHALWSRWIGRGRLPMRVGNLLFWLQADGDRSLLRATRVSDGTTTTLARGGFMPDVERSGAYLAVVESHDALPRDTTFAIGHHIVVVDLSDPNKPVLAAPSREVPGAGFEHFLGGRDAPGAFWFLLTSSTSFTVARWHAGTTELVTFAGSYGTYANIAIDAVCGNVAVNACDRKPSCTIEMASLDGVVSRRFDLPSRVGVAAPLPWEGEVMRLIALRPDGLTYDWMSLESYTLTPKTITFGGPCRP
jgi:hypothetical protein